ncbi:MAG: cupin domain-containing protein [Cytophagaceae bacterium]|nr:cupin domain-containing protein [Gemmatimonadaceae bacterium]
MSEERLRPPPKERLAASVQRVNLAEAAAALRAEPHAAVTGHRQVALVRRGPVSQILFAFDADGLFKEHKTEGEVTIHVLAGQMAVTVDSEAITLRAGEILALAPGEVHSVYAVSASDMLLTVCQVPAKDAPVARPD